MRVSRSSPDEKKNAFPPLWAVEGPRRGVHKKNVKRAHSLRRVQEEKVKGKYPKSWREGSAIFPESLIREGNGINNKYPLIIYTIVRKTSAVCGQKE